MPRLRNPRNCIPEPLLPESDNLRSFASFFSGGQWVCWQLSTATLMTGITHRVDAILTTGDLLSTEGGTLRLYDSSGAGTSCTPLP